MKRMILLGRVVVLSAVMVVLITGCDTRRTGSGNTTDTTNGSRSAAETDTTGRSADQHGTAGETTGTSR